ncbi:MAG: SAM-dependent methyltransferase [Magnetococcus sp. YQC-5]
MKYCQPLYSQLFQEMASCGGAVPFCRFMELALYHPTHGYYMSQKPRIGREGDFVTAPELTSIFGELLTLQCVEIWEQLGCPDRFTVVEMGGGTGRLALDILQTARRFPAFLASLAYVLVEASHDFRARQQCLLAENGIGSDLITWQTTLPEEVAAGVIMGNEFLDALPVHWVEMTQDGLREVGVTQGGAGGVEMVLLEPVPPLSADYFASIGIHLEPGYRTEVGLAAAAWMEEAGRVLQRGVVLIVDYGYLAAEYYAPWRTMGTLVGHRGHERMDDPSGYFGEMDLTAHVDFTAMARAGQRAGLSILGYTTQSWFLMGLGILERLEQVTRNKTHEDASLLREAVMRLLMPHEMGERFKVLAMGRGMKEGGLSGFRLNDQRQRI